MRKRRSTFKRRLSHGAIIAMLAVFAAQGHEFAKANEPLNAIQAHRAQIRVPPPWSGFDLWEGEYEMLGFTATSPAASGAAPSSPFAW